MMEIIEYNSSYNLKVKFDDGYIKEARYDTFKQGTVLHPLDKFVLNIGYLGYGNYETRDKINKKDTFLYTEWHSMLSRCYNKNQQKSDKNKSYKLASVDKVWYNFQNFAKWYTENFYEIKNDKLVLDKDILHKGNKIYSPDNCILVPERINKLFITSKGNRGKYPIGVTNQKGRFRARGNYYDKDNKYKSKHLGYFNTPEEAFYAYKEFKESYIKQVADHYKDKIPKKLYDAMYRYEVEITD